MSRSFVPVASVAAVCVAALSACGSEVPGPAPAEWSVSFRWTAEPAIDFDGFEGVHVRAAIESNTIATFFDIDNGYPGWTDHPGAVDLSAREPHPEQSVTGTAYLHLIQVPLPAGDSVLVVCKDMTGVARKQGSRYLVPDPVNDQETFEAIAVEVLGGGLPPQYSRRTKPTEPPPGPVLAGPDGRSARPATNVFALPVQVYYPHGGQQYRNFCAAWNRWKPGGLTPGDEPPSIRVLLAPTWAGRDTESYGWSEAAFRGGHRAQTAPRGRVDRGRQNRRANRC